MLALALYTVRGQSFSAPAPHYGYRIVHVYPHDPLAFTQGLEYHAGLLYEGTGLEGRSTLRKEELATARVVEEIHIPAQFFGEGITVLNGQVVQLTWQAQEGFVYRQANFQLLKTFHYPGEGWGLANDGHQIYMSDGTAQIRCLDPASLAETRRFTVHDGGKTIDQLNELEWVRGRLFANIWQTDEVAEISPDDGRVLAFLDLGGLLTAEDQRRPVDVLNGIAYDAARDRLFVTGKLWPKLFEIRVLEAK